MADTFDVVVGANKTRYASAKEAGAAFFEADITQRPGVIHGMPTGPDTGPGGSGRFMANTAVHGQYEDGSTRYVKGLPDSDKEVDKDFREGYVDALDKSVNERLKAADWEAVKPEHPSAAPKLNPRLYDDLDQLSKNDFEKAAKAWEEHVPQQGTIGPTFVDRGWKRQNAEARQIAAVLDASEHGEAKAPEENARRAAVKKARKAVELIQLEPDAADEKNIVEPVKEKELEVIDGKEAVARANLLRQREREQEALGIKAEGKRINVESLSEKALEQDDANDIAERTGGITDRESQQYTERGKNRQVELMEQVHSQFRVAGAKFYFKDQPGKLAMKDKGERMVSASNDDRVAKAMATMAEAKGWKTIKVSGHPDFQREVWMEASFRGIEARGYKPSEQDLKLLEDKRERAMRNTVEHEQTARERKPEQQRQDRAVTAAKVRLRAYAGRVIEHSAANFNHDPKEKPNYFVKLATDQGEKTVWGVDLKRAMSEGKVKAGDDVKLEYRGNTPVPVEALKRDKAGNVIGKEAITRNRNQWDVQKSDKAKVVQAVASAFIESKVKDPAQREALKAAVGARMAEREKANKVPAVPVYDKAAPAKSQQPERTRPVVERNAERTR